jgi:CheY-like chemotaxis protein
MPYRILVVEDEADTREVLTILLGRDAHLVDTAESGPEASNYSHGAATT